MPDFENMVAEREYELHTGGGPPERVVVQVGRPSREADAGPWGCAVRVAAPSRVVERVAYGPDALEALFLAVQMARVEVLHTLPRQTGGRLTYLGQADLRLPDPFPAPPPA
jgi:hypothetical protein